MATRHSINGLAEILTWMESLDYDQNTLLANTNIDPMRLTDPNGTVSNKEELTFYKNLLDVSNDPYIYLKAGMTLNIGAYGLWGLALLSSPTIGKAIEFGLQYIGFSYTYNNIDFFNDNHTSSLIITSSQGLGTLEKPMVERDISAIYMIFTALLQNSHPLNHIRVSWKSGGDNESALYKKLFQCPVIFDCSINEVVFDQSLIAHELPQKNPLTMKLCQLHLDQQLPTIKMNDTVSAQIEQYFIRTPAFKINIHDCAQEFDFSTRHLNRILSNEKTSFKTLLDKFKQKLAEQYLSQTSMKLEEIAERIGYSDAASFSHAFKRWTGNSPRKFRINS